MKCCLRMIFLVALISSSNLHTIPARSHQKLLNENVPDAHMAASVNLKDLEPRTLNSTRSRPRTIRNHVL